jgi:hypothetical protein
MNADDTTHTAQLTSPEPGAAARTGPASGPADLVRGGGWKSRSPGPAANGFGGCGTGCA